MKAKLKLLKGQTNKNNMHPIYVELVDGKLRKRKFIGFSLAAHWNFEKNVPLKGHPEFNMLMPLVLDYKSKIMVVNYEYSNFGLALDFLFGDVSINSLVFYEAGLKFCDNSTTGKLFKTVLISFNKFAPGVLVENITKDIATDYMNYLLKINKPNGVHTYLRKLGTLFNRISPLDNPFKGVRPKKVKTPKKRLEDLDVLKIINTRTIVNKFDGKNTIETINYPRYYWMLLFYLGGIDMVDLAHLRYDKHVFNGRVQFNRYKGGTNAVVNNKIFPEAEKILNKFNCYPYLVPIYTYKDYKSFVNWSNRSLYKTTLDLELTKKPLSKSARASFINRAQQLLIDERITKEIVGHEQQSVHSIYTDAFPLDVRDAAHEKIITI